MSEWLPKKEWNAEKKVIAEYEAEIRAKSGRTLVTHDERATLSAEELGRLSFNRWMELKHTG